MWRCLAQHMPERLAAGHFASVCGTFIGGTHPDTGRAVHHHRAAAGRLGGAARDATATAPCSAASTERPSIVPAEVNEARNGLWVDRMELNTEPGGEGEFTGGTRHRHGLSGPRRQAASSPRGTHARSSPPGPSTAAAKARPTTSISSRRTGSANASPSCPASPPCGTT